MESHNPPHPGPASSLALVPFSNRCRTPSNPLAHHPVSSFDIICNSPSPWLANIVLFGLPLKVFKMRLIERGFHTLKGSSVLFLYLLLRLSGRHFLTEMKQGDAWSVYILYYASFHQLHNDNTPLHGHMIVRLL